MDEEYTIMRVKYGRRGVQIVGWKCDIAQGLGVHTSEGNRDIEEEYDIYTNADDISEMWEDLAEVRLLQRLDGNLLRAGPGSTINASLPDISGMRMGASVADSQGTKSHEGTDVNRDPGNTGEPGDPEHASFGLDELFQCMDKKRKSLETEDSLSVVEEDAAG